MKQKILVISYVPTHPQDAGNRTRVYNMIESMKKINKDVYFLFIKRSNRRYAKNDRLYRKR
jgi:hypothetical protein